MGEGVGEERQDGERWCVYLKKLGSRLGNCMVFLISTVKFSALILGPILLKMNA